MSTVLSKKQMTEEDIKLNYITPAILKGWKGHITMETKITDGRINIRGNIVARSKPKFVDYMLYLNDGKPIAVVEAKDNNHSVSHGLQQAMTYAQMMDLPFAYSSNGDAFYEHNFLTGQEQQIALDKFPTQDELVARYYAELNGGKGISDLEKKIVSQPYYSSQSTYPPRYYQRNAVNRTVEAIARGQQRLLLVMATGTGGFITSWLGQLSKQVTDTTAQKQLDDSIYGIEKKPFPYLLCVTNMLLHDIEVPNIYHMNSLKHNLLDYTDDDKFDVILMNPPYGGHEDKSIQNFFPDDLTSSETADLFMSVIMYRLKKNGRAAVILPDGFLFGTDNAKVAIKKKLFSEFNLHTVIRMPHSVFAPYTSITTNILFFDHTKPTEETWFYRLDMPEGYKNFSKTKPMELKHFDPAMDWWDNREEINVDGFDKAKKFTVAEIAARNYNIDLCGYPHEEEEILPPKELIQQYQEKRASLNADIDRILAQITEILGIDLEEE